MRTVARTLLAGALLSAPTLTWAYEVDTHEELSAAAVDASVLKKQTEVLTNLGLKPLGDLQTFPNSQGNPRTVVQLFREGSRFEDGFKCSDSRPRNHFYDPTHNGQGLQWGLITGKPSPDWALEDINSIGDQDFSFQDGRGYFYKALTEPKKIDRDKNFGLTFQTIGHVIHHIEDMAQPQHVRNDPHYVAPEDCGVVSYLGKILGDNHSRYELYTNANRGNFPSLPGYAPVYSDGGSNTFSTPRKFWATGTGAGLAEFTNRNFVSAGTNFALVLKDGTLIPTPNLRYVSPEPEITKELNVDIKTLLPGTALTGTLAFFGNSVYDRYNSNTYFNGRAASLSLFDQDLQKYNAAVSYIDFDTGETYVTNKLFTLNRFNFDAAHQFLIPRAVGYSAGLVNYFFRGEMDFVPDKTDSTKYVIKNLGQEAMDGTFTLYYDDAKDIRHPVPGASWSLAIAKNGKSVPLSFIVPVDPAPKNGGEYMLVFNGTLGQETNAVVGRWKPVPLVVVVGYADSSIGTQAFRWTKSSGMVGLGFLDGPRRSSATGVSADDGSVVVGNSYDSSRHARAFRWEAGKMINLGALPNGDYSVATAVSADGSVVVGTGDTGDYYNKAIIWTKNGDGSFKIENLGKFAAYPPGYEPTGPVSTRATSVSADGKIVVGQADWEVREISRFEFGDLKVAYVMVESFGQAFRWTREEGMKSIIDLKSATFTSASSISADGSTIVGRAASRLGRAVPSFLIESEGISLGGYYGLQPYTGAAPTGNTGIGSIYAAYQAYVATVTGLGPSTTSITAAGLKSTYNSQLLGIDADEAIAATRRAALLAAAEALLANALASGDPGEIESATRHLANVKQYIAEEEAAHAAARARFVSGSAAHIALFVARENYYVACRAASKFYADSDVAY